MIIDINLSLVGMSIVLLLLAADISRCCKIKSDILNIVFPILSIVLALAVGSIFPKILARYNAEKIGIATLPSIIKFAAVFKVVIKFLLNISNRITKLFNVQHIENRYIKTDGIDFLLSNENTSPLPNNSRRFVSNIMDFTERKISQVMVSLSEIFAVDLDLPKEKIIKRIIATKYSRVQIYRGNINNIVGIIYTKNLAVAWRNSGIIVLEDLIYHAYYVPENAKISEILKELKKRTPSYRDSCI